MESILGLFGIFIALGGLMYLAYRGINVLFLAPLMALVAVLFQSGTPWLATYTQVFMPALGNYLIQYFPIFILGSIFGKIMADSGAAQSIAESLSARLGPRHSTLAVVLACAVLTYGGVSLFVVAFTIYPIAVHLYDVAKLPRRLIPGAIALGSFTFTMTALPGTPAIQNAIPMPVFGTSAFAAPVVGIVAGLFMLGFGLLWLSRQAQKAPTEVMMESPVTAKPTESSLSVSSGLPLGIALAPLFLVLIANYYFSHHLFPGKDLSYLSLPQYGNVSPQKVVGLWSLIAALSLGILSSLILFRRQSVPWIQSINEGSLGSMLPIFNTASEVGFGAVIASLAAFAFIKDSLLEISPGSPLVSLAVTVNILAGITGSASGGLSIALGALGETYKEMALASGVSLEVMHRVASIACSGLDTLPHNGAVITLLSICKMTHKDSYLDIFMVAVVGTVLATVLAVVLGTLMGGL